MASGALLVTFTSDDLFGMSAPVLILARNGSAEQNIECVADDEVNRVLGKNGDQRKIVLVMLRIPFMTTAHINLCECVLQSFL